MDLIQAFKREKGSSAMLSRIAIITSISLGRNPAGTSFPTRCPRCGSPAEGWTEDGVNLRVKCKICGYEGTIPHPDLPERPWRVG